MEMEEYKRDACGSYLKEVAAFFDEIFPGKEKTLLRLCFPKQGLSTVWDTASRRCPFFVRFRRAVSPSGLSLKSDPFTLRDTVPGWRPPGLASPLLDWLGVKHIEIDHYHYSERYRSKMAAT